MYIMQNVCTTRMMLLLWDHKISIYSCKKINGEIAIILIGCILHCACAYIPVQYDHAWPAVFRKVYWSQSALAKASL